ncbi:hypothetical protein MATL_G00050480 [Megalops atlanticus]|uniref:Ig-like domain-containing protein n=1 Tax=Megalops atlanticus TaxID=7932 RepID=A0A9D3QFW9_MEGAT|nr:hypothetical protein MATL_G00050480 [Megalops atlanticus]
MFQKMFAAWPAKNLSRKGILFWIAPLCLYAQSVVMDDTIRVAGKLGGMIFLHPTKLHENIFEVKWRHSNTSVGKLKNGSLNLHDSRYCISPNGTLTLNSTNTNDAGRYTLEIFDSDGRNIVTNEFELRILGVVSMPTVHTSCTVDGRVQLTCSVERGDNVILHWKMYADLSNYTLNTTSTTKHHILYLGKSTPGQLVCVAGNQVSQKYSVPITMTCRARVSTFIALGIAILAPTLTIVILKLKRKLPKTRRDDAEENIYIAMHGNHVNRDKAQDSTDAEQDTSHYVECSPVPPGPRGDSDEYAVDADAENVYM